MKESQTVIAEIGLQGTNIKLSIPFSEFNLIQANIKNSKSKWIKIQLDDDAFVDVNTDKVQFMRVRPVGVRQLKKRDGYTLKSICAVTGANYDVLRQKIKREGIQLDYGSERRVLLTPLSIRNLNITPEQLKKIKTQ